MAYTIFQYHLQFLEKTNTLCCSGSYEHKSLEQSQEVHRKWSSC